MLKHAKKVKATLMASAREPTDGSDTTLDVVLTFVVVKSVYEDMLPCMSAVFVLAYINFAFFFTKTQKKPSK